MSLAPVPPSRAAASPSASDATPKLLKSSARAPVSTYLPRSMTDPAQPLPRAAQGHSTRPLGPAALPKPQTGRKVSEGLAKHASTCSSAVAMDEFRSSTSQFPPGADGREARRVFLVKRRADEVRAQQLRGIFASHDTDRDGLISMTELSRCLLMIGVEPNASILETYRVAASGASSSSSSSSSVRSPAPPTTTTSSAASRSNETALVLSDASILIDETVFVRVTVRTLDNPMTTEPLMESLFAEFDKTNTGRVPLSTLLHVLCQVDSPSALTVTEVNELLRLTGIMTELQNVEQEAIYATDVDYKALLRHLMFPIAQRSGLEAAYASVEATSRLGGATESMVAVQSDSLRAGRDAATTSVFGTPYSTASAVGQHWANAHSPTSASSSNSSALEDSLDRTTRVR